MPKYVKRRFFCTCGSNNWETVEHRWLDAARGLANTKLSFHSCNVLRILSPKSSWKGMGRGVPLPSGLGGLGERRKLPQWVPGQSPGQKRILV